MPFLVVVLACAGSFAVGGEPRVSKLAESLAGDDAVARYLAEEQLVEMGDAALPALKPLVLSEGLTPARRDAFGILARIRTPQSIRCLLDVLEGEKDLQVRGVVCGHLGRLGVEEAVPVIGKWLMTVRGQTFRRKEWWESGPWTDWILHVHALREIGSEAGVPLLGALLQAKNPGEGGAQLMRSYREDLEDLRQEKHFWAAVRGVEGLEPRVKRLFASFRTDTLAGIRLYRTGVVRLGIQGRWALEGMTHHPDAQLREDAAVFLKHYDRLQP